MTSSADPTPADRAPAGPPMAGKTVVITGATGGIGLEAAIAIAGQGASLVLVGRDPERGRQALSRIRRAVPGAVAEIHIADLSRLAEVRALAETLKTLPRIDVLLNNAGAMFERREVTEDGLERTFALNHMAYFVLTLQLLDLLKRSAPARIVNVASEAHRGVTLDLADLQLVRGYGGWLAYRRSKLCNILFTRALAKRLDGTGVTANAVHPGLVASGFGNNNGGLYGIGIRIAKLAGIRPEQGARTPVMVATAPALADVTGGYFARGKPLEPAAPARNDETAARLWDESLRLGGFTGA